jgi:bifunctional non-homologous end joining protein LigD
MEADRLGIGRRHERPPAPRPRDAQPRATLPGRLGLRAQARRERCLAEHTGARTRLSSRSGRDVTASFPELEEALARQSAGDFLLDGEVVAFDGDRTSFARLQPRIHVSDRDRARGTGVPVFYYVFDVLRAGGEDLTSLPLLDRKSRLRDLLTFRDPVRYVPHRRAADEDWFGDICARGWEGLIAKRADAPYVSGRTREWLKLKCEMGQELVVVGWTEPQASRVGLGALLLAYHDGDDLVYAGKVGTGFSDAELRRLHDRLTMLEVGASPCTRGRLPTRDVHWARPKLVAEIAFTEWTGAGQLRHPRYLGLRRDKSAEDVVREHGVTRAGRGSP